MTEAKLDPSVARGLDAFVDDARAALQEQLRAAVLFGSAASAELRATSDVNLVLVLQTFDPTRIAALRESLRTAHALLRLEVMFLLVSEIDLSAQAFPDKFADILRRRRVLFGEDPFTHLTLSRADEVRRLIQALHNLVLRLRNRYAFTSLREEQAARALAETAGPMRAAAAMLLDLCDEPYDHPKDALVRIAKQAAEPDLISALDTVSRAREGHPTAQGTSGAALLGMITLAGHMRDRALRLPESAP